MDINSCSICSCVTIFFFGAVNRENNHLAKKNVYVMIMNLEMYQEEVRARNLFFVHRARAQQVSKAVPMRPFCSLSTVVYRVSTPLGPSSPPPQPLGKHLFVPTCSALFCFPPSPSFLL